MASEIVEILDHEKIPVVHGVAHDWGSFLLGRLANYYPKKLASASFLNVAYRAPGGVLNLDVVNAMTKQALGYEMCGYWKFFETEGAGEIVNKNVSSFLFCLAIFVTKDAGQISAFYWKIVYFPFSFRIYTNNAIRSTPFTVFVTAKIPTCGRSIWHHSEL